MSWYLRCSWCEVWFNRGICHHCTNVSYGNGFVCNPDSISNDETADFSYPPSQPQTSLSVKFHCFGSGDPLEEVYVVNSVLESINPLNEIIPQIPPSNAIILVLPTFEDPEDSLIIGNKELNTILEKESNTFIKSSIENLVPILSEFEYTFGSSSEYVLYSCGDFSPINVSEGKPVYSDKMPPALKKWKSGDAEESINPLNEIIPQIPPSNAIILVLPTFEDPEDSLIIGNKELNTILEKESNTFIKSSIENLVPILSEFEYTFGSSSEVLENIENKDSYLDEPNLLVTPLSNANLDEFLDPGDDVELLLHHDPSTLRISFASILEGFTDEQSLEENDDLFDLESKENKWKKILYDAPINDLMTEDKIFVLEIHDKKISLTYVTLPFEERQYIFFTYVI
uniref:Uncharacterized protein n=1 Tax=Tanacetum cinerariifolium TaxID=118510 RepID=A0A6L2KNA1_TANCI|nr:hypothetical protein [Tanacetum cinerariifolium]